MEKIKKLDVKKLLNNNNENSNKDNLLLILCGCSGSGKTSFESSLIKSYPKFFNKLPQITTREKRNKYDNGYYFVDKVIYDFMYNSLIGRLGNFNNNQYGTIPVFDRSKINTIIASYDAIEDIFATIDSKKLSIKPMIILMDIDNTNITSNGKRDDRDISFLKKEREELYNVYETYKDRCIYSYLYKYEDKNRFIDISDVMIL